MDGAHNLDIDVSTCARLIPPPGTVAGDHWQCAGAGVEVGPGAARRGTMEC